MSDTYARALTCTTELYQFAANILKIDAAERPDCCRNILHVELELQKYLGMKTLTDSGIRVSGYKHNAKRESLRKQIFDELISLKRLENDDEIRLGMGGALPKTGVNHEKTIFYIIGLPASGKSGIAGKIADCTGSVIVDSDYAKRKLPEYHIHSAGSSIVHDESSAIMFSYEPNNVFGYCVSNDYNIVMPKIGNNLSVIIGYADKLYEFGYRFILVSVDLDRQKATRRAYDRFVDTGRYVPLSMIFDDFSNEPSLNYFKIKQMKPKSIAGYCQISTDVEFGQKPVIIEMDHIDMTRVFQ